MLFRFCAYGFLKNLRFFEPFLLLFFTVEKGLSYTQFGALVAVREVAVYVLEIPTGIIADVTGRRRAMVLAFGSYLLSFSIFSAFGTFWAFVPAMVLFGAGEAFRSGTHKSMIMQHLDLEGMSEQRVHYYGTTRSASRLGSALAVLVAGALVFSANNYQVVFAASMVPYSLGLLLMLSYPRALDGKVAGAFGMKAFMQHTVDSFKGIWRTRELLKVLLNASTADSFFRVARDYLQPILRDAATTLAVSLPVLAFADTTTERTAVLVAAVYFAIHINEFLASRYSGRLAERIGHLGRALNFLFWLLAAAFCVAGGGLFLRTGSPGTTLAYAGLGIAVLMLLLFYTLNNLRMPIVTGFLADRTVPQQRATVLSVYSQLRAVLAALVAPLLGVVADHLGLPFVFLAGGVALLAAGAFLHLEGGSADGPTGS
jgi:MFS family permease